MNKLEWLGRWFVELILSVPAIIRTFFRPYLWIKPLDQILVGGLPLAIATGLALGTVIWMHTRGVLERSGTGAVELLPTFLAAAVLLELAPIGAGLIVAARTGASLGAEIASMRVNEQLDAMALLGISIRNRLVAPKVIGCLLALPLLHVVIAVLAIGSGFVAETVIGRTTWLSYQTAVLRELYLVDVIPALLKTFIFGWLIGVTGCFVGLNARGGSEEIGQAATESVVTCVLAILIADVFLVGLFRALV